MSSNPANIYELNSPPQDAISSLSFSPFATAHTRLIASSWDKTLRLYDLIHDATAPSHGGAELIKFEHAAPVLDACWGSSENEIFTGGIDQQVKLLNPETQSKTVLGTHDNAVKSVCWNQNFRTLFTGSWDCSVQTFDPRSPTPSTGRYSQPHKIFSMSTIDDKLVVAMAARSVYIYDIKNMSTPLQQRESSLKFMTRVVCCMPNGQGYASSSIEGRVAVEFFDPSPEAQAKKYAFKCHRQVENGVDMIYPVNALAFHPIYGTFASGGGDGVVSLWDGAAKRRLRQYPRLPASVAALSFSNDGKHLGVAVSSGMEDGKDISAAEDTGSVRIFIRELAEGEGKGKNQQNPPPVSS